MVFAQEKSPNETKYQAQELTHVCIKTWVTVGLALQINLTRMDFLINEAMSSDYPHGNNENNVIFHWTKTTLGRLKT